jgi:hypothetical protein
MIEKGKFSEFPDFFLIHTSANGGSFHLVKL